MADPARVLLSCAAASWAANCALGTSVATGMVDTRGCRWVHHALYTATGLLTGAAELAALATRARSRWSLLPACAVMLAIPYVRAGTRGHVALALAALPSYAFSLSRLWARRRG